MRILVVDDEPGWAIGLQRMYREILGAEHCAVEIATSCDEAEPFLKVGVDLLSLDLNIGGQDGRDLLYRAGGARRLANGVILITRAHVDEKLDMLIPGEDDRLAIRQGFLSTIAEVWFPGRNVVLYKAPLGNNEIDTNIRSYRKILDRPKLEELGAAPLQYTVRICAGQITDDGRVPGAHVEIIVGNPQNRVVTINEPHRAELLFHLARNRQIFDDRPVTCEEVLHLLKHVPRGGRSDPIRTRIATFRRWLEREKKVQPAHLLASIYGGRGWKLAPGVVASGAHQLEPEYRIQLRTPDVLIRSQHRTKIERVIRGTDAQFLELLVRNREIGRLATAQEVVQCLRTPTKSEAKPSAPDMIEAFGRRLRNNQVPIQPDHLIREHNRHWTLDERVRVSTDDVFDKRRVIGSEYLDR